MRGIALLIALLCVTTPAHAQRSVEIRGDRLSGVVLPVVPLPGDIEMLALRGWAWTVDDTKRLVLRGGVEINISGQLLTTDAAVVWVNRLPTAEGVVTQIAVYMDEVANPSQPAGLGVTGRRLLVTASARGESELRVDLLERDPPKRSAFLRRAEDRLALHLRRVVGEPQQMSRRPVVDRPDPPYAFVPEPGGTLTQRDLDLPTTIDLPRTSGRRPWLRDPDGFVTFAAQRIDVVPGTEENTISATGSIVVEYYAEKQTEDLSQLTLQADRAVIFTAAGSIEDLATRQIDVEQLRGVYLEGNVIASANDGAYVVRSPRIYYDFTTSRAIMLDAVLRTYVRDGKRPIYARAEELRQIAAESWESRNVRVSTSEFATGHLSLGAERAVVTRRPVPGGGPDERETYFETENIVLRAGDLPVFGWPGYKGTVDEVPLRGISVGGSQSTGVDIETRWNLWSLLGNEAPPGVDATLLLDGFTKRGPAGGLDLNYDVAAGMGALNLYLMYDNGTDRTSSGRDVPQDDALRGYALWEHNWDLTDSWLLQLQGAYISDPSFITTWREDDFAERREYETSAFLAYQNGRHAFQVLSKYALNDFISNSWLLASTQFTVDRAPEIGYFRFGDKLFGSAITYSGETRYSRVRFRLVQSTPNELGVRGRAFGVAPNTNVDTKQLARGFPTNFVNRFDSRHEFSLPVTWKEINIVPFAVGRATYYDDSFESYTPGGVDELRFFGTAGVRVSMRLQHVDSSVENRLLDLHRVRHIVEPSVTAWYGYTNVDESELPAYDEIIEQTSQGAAVRLGMRNTWQTQRGGPGRWRSVDVLTLDTDVVFISSDTDRTSPNPQFFDYRPEYSQFGNHFYGSLMWLLSDSLSLAGQVTYDFDDNDITRASIGTSLEHTPRLTTFVEYRFLNASESKLLDVGGVYQMTPKYRVAVRPQWDFDKNDLRELRLVVTRSFPDFDFTFIVRYDNIQDETSIGASLDLAEF